MVSEQKDKKIVQITSIVIPVVVGLLFGIRQKIYMGEWTSYLPALNAVLNGTTSLLLIGAVLAIKSKNIQLHKKLMLVAVVLGACFLVSYVIYHLSNKSTKFGGEGFIVYVYYFILISHILLSIVVLRFVLLALFYAKHKDFDKHKKIVKFGFPIWLYVSISGVLVYVMISPYY